MRSIARQSARLASNSRVRQQHVRSLSQSVPLHSDARSPSGPHDHSTPVESRQVSEAACVKEGEKRAAGPEHAAAAQDKSTDKVGGGKTLKQRRIEKAQKLNIPKPPPVPDWFLKHNVRLQTDAVPPDLSAKTAQVLRCVDNDTGHTLFALPYYEAWAVPGLPGRSNEESRPDKNAAARKGPGPLEQSFFDNKFTSPPSDETRKETIAKSGAPEILVPPGEHPYIDINTHTLLRWSLLEAETSVRAAFAMAAQGPQTHLNAASKVDISLFCPDSEAHEEMDQFVEDLGNLTQSDIIRLDANDFEELLIDYVESGSDAPGTFSRLAYDVFDGAVAAQSARAMEEAEDEEMDEDEEDEDEEEESRGGSDGFNERPGSFEKLEYLQHLRKALYRHRNDLGRALGQLKSTGAPFALVGLGNRAGSESRNPFQSNIPADSVSWDEARLKALLDTLLDAPKEKRARFAPPQASEFRSRLLQLHNGRVAPDDNQALWRVRRSSPGSWLPDIAGILAGRIHHATVTEPTSDRPPLKLEAVASTEAETDSKPASMSQRIIVHIRDVKDIARSSMGQVIIDSLVRNVKRRRKAGQEILVVGTTAQDESDSMFAGMRSDDPTQALRDITIPPYFRMSKDAQSRLTAQDFEVDTTDGGDYRRILEINLRHMDGMLRRLRPEESIDLFSDGAQAQLKLAGAHPLSQKVFSFNMVQRVVLTAIGLARSHATSPTITASHLALAIYTTVKADQAAQVWTNHRSSAPKSPIVDAQINPRKPGQDTRAEPEQTQARMDKLKKTCNPHEVRLLAGVVDPQNIKTGFKEVHAPPETIDALKTMTSLSLLRPDAFKYGVLAADRLPGLMLYGPPGTGKTLLAKAVAKESRATVLEISGAQIYEKYVGEGEKMVRAVFSLAKKLSPCIIFIDEADAIFGSRSGAGNRNTHREIINQFLREWDGMDLHNVFVMVASNRPFDMDDAVLRRLPRRLLVDLPVAKDRESIMKIHLKDEMLDETVDLPKLSEQTPLYSGSDLKNLCVAAALACVREENELAESKQEEKGFQLPAKRTLHARHFEKAIKEISASISEDMSSLTAIKKFDEQFGDRRGRRKKAAYGFGMGDAGIDEGAARVRGTAPPPP